MATQTDLDSRTEQSPYAEQRYEQHRGDREALNISEYAALVKGYLREYVCMGQCNLYIESASDPEIIEAIKVYLSDVCDPNFSEMKTLLEKNGMKLPVDPDNPTPPDQVEHVETNAIDDQMIVIAQWFAAQSFMNLCNQLGAMAERTDVRDAFLRNYHRANRWHVAFYDLAVKKGFLMPLPTLDAKGMLRTTVMGM
jgi:hypothetical protein